MSADRYSSPSCLSPPAVVVFVGCGTDRLDSGKEKQN